MLKRYAYKNARTKQRYKLRGVSVLLLLTLLFFVGLLTGCGATLPVVPPVTPRLPSKPELTTPLPSQPYSQTVREWLEKSRAKLMGM
jgi:hypothetical protein